MLDNPIIHYQLIQHNGNRRIAVQFDYNKEWNNRLKAVKGAQWSNTHHCWTIPDTNDNREKCGLPPKLMPADSAIAQRLQAALDRIKLKGYSKATAKTYGLHLREYFTTIQLKYNIDEVTKD